MRGHDTIVTVLNSVDQFERDKLSGWLTAMLRGTSGTSAAAPTSVSSCRCHRWERRPAARVHIRHLEKTAASTIGKCHAPQKTTSTHPFGSVIERPNKAADRSQVHNLPPILGLVIRSFCLVVRDHPEIACDQNADLVVGPVLPAFARLKFELFRAQSAAIPPMYQAARTVR